ncbi:MAG: hypothetical protein ACI9IL_000081 [Rickettsiales bacterium]|jgi:hypothetical protein
MKQKTSHFPKNFHHKFQRNYSEILVKNGTTW